MNIVVILAGGTGSRADAPIPKQYVEVGGRPMIAFCLETFFAHEEIHGVQIVAEEAWRDYILGYVRQIESGSAALADARQAEEESAVPGKFRGFSEPGENRQMSIFHALSDIRDYAKETDTVIIHDAARPYVKAAQISRLLADMEGHEGAIPVLPMKDTVYMTDGECICGLLDRARVCAGQAPEAFLLGRYYEANRALLPDRILSVVGSTEPAVLAGMDIRLSEGDEGNIKVTTEKDMADFKIAAEDTVTLAYEEYRRMKARIELLEILAGAEEDVAHGKVAPIEETFDGLRDLLR
ncbi:MAG: 2-C-methyl-D-erythritol 4-phosphate cytidylyltransferase [Lachnospiraceae bacterium]|nr:2-C-methyl-D-erythritol 4-phosphate cytidylyltransferase [Lachnospiraceae bacterium]